MDFAYNLILILHFIGLASVVGGFIVQMKSREKGVNAAMLHGAITQLVTGLLLVGIPELGLALPYPGWESWNHITIAVKLLFTIAITVLAIIGRRRGGTQIGLWGAIGGLSIANIFIAVLW